MTEASGKPDRGKLAAWLEMQGRAAWKAWKDYRASFVFRKELGNWPVVRRFGPGVYTLTAFHTGPGRVLSRGGYKPPVFTGMALGALYCFAYRNTVPPEDLWFYSFIVGVVCIFASIPFWKLAQKTRLVIRFEDGGMSWRGPDKVRRKLGPDDDFTLEAGPHRRGTEEGFMHAEFRRRNQDEPPQPLYQVASELILHKGFRGRDWLPVAEICNDESLQDAHRLKSGIEFVIRAAAAELADLETRAASTGPL